MPDTTDMDLLRDYAENQSESAFNELIHRHIRLVYSVARRFVRNDEDAQDVTQAVFIILARKAAGLRPKTILAGWLYETTRFTSMKFLTSKARRQQREKEAYMQSTLNDSAADWQLLEPHLEDAMSELAERDRTLLVLRFYENKTGAEAAARCEQDTRRAVSPVNGFWADCDMIAQELLRDCFSRLRFTDTFTDSWPRMTLFHGLPGGPVVVSQRLGRWLQR